MTIKKIGIYLFVLTLVFNIYGCSKDNPKPTEPQNEVSDTNPDEVNTIGLKNKDMDQLCKDIQEAVLQYFDDHQIDASSYQWPGESDDELLQYWGLIVDYTNYYVYRINQGMSSEDIENQFKDEYNNEYFTDDTRDVMFVIAKAAGKWLSEHSEYQDLAFNDRIWKWVVTDNISF